MEISFEDLNSTDLKLLQSSYKILEKLGTGAFGVVWKAYELSTGKIVAIKEIKANAKHANVLSELNLLKSLEHPNIVSYYDYLEDQSVSYIIMEYLEGGTLKAFIEKNQGRISETQASTIARQLLNALSYLHYTCDICHRDVKPDNVMFAVRDDISTLKLLDFGLSKDSFEDRSFLENCGTLVYMAPEQITKMTYSKAVDIWSVGVIIYMMLDRRARHPFYAKGEGTEEVVRKIKGKKVEFNRAESPISEMAKHLITKLLWKNSSYRYTARQALRHPWITQNKFGEIPLTIYDKYGQKMQVRNLILLMQISLFLNFFRKNKFEANEDSTSSASFSKEEASPNNSDFIKKSNFEAFDFAKYTRMVEESNRKYNKIFMENRLKLFDPNAVVDDKIVKKLGKDSDDAFKIIENKENITDNSSSAEENRDKNNKTQEIKTKNKPLELLKTPKKAKIVPKKEEKKVGNRQNFSSKNIPKLGGTKLIIESKDKEQFYYRYENRSLKEASEDFQRNLRSSRKSSEKELFLLYEKKNMFTALKCVNNKSSIPKKVQSDKNINIKRKSSSIFKDKIKAKYHVNNQIGSTNFKPILPKHLRITNVGNGIHPKKLFDKSENKDVLPKINLFKESVE